ncbi:MAG: ComF family protein [Phycisphaerae bacterium]|nr:ComF family protein [Phycisphaerae bacterium]
MEPKPDKFLWPPNPTELAAPAQPLSEGARHLLTHASDSVDLDVIAEEPADELSGEFEIPASPIPPQGVRRFLEVIETHFLGRTSAPWNIRAANWTRDEPGNYCPRCGTTCRPFQLDTLTDPATCVRCRGKRPAWDRFIRLGSYEGVLARSVRELKFGGLRALGESLGRELGLALRAEIELRSINPSRVVLVPMPMTPWRRISRGIDHTLVLARGTRRASGFAIQRLLARRHRPSQVSLPVSERRRNVSGAFFCRRTVLNVRPDAVLVVLDDVRTTGATLTEACRTLRAGLNRRKGAPNKQGTGGGPQVWAAAVGVAPSPGERESESEGARGNS